MKNKTKYIIILLAALLLMIFSSTVVLGKYFIEKQAGTFDLEISALPRYTLAGGIEFNNIIKKPSSNIVSIIFGYTDDYRHQIKDVSGVAVDKDQNGNIKAYHVLDSDNSTYTVYILSDGKIMTNTDTNSMFNNLQKLQTVEFLNFDTSQLLDMSSMFNFCTNLKSVDLTGFDTSKVTHTTYLFNRCKSLETLDLSDFDTSKVVNSYGMFNGCNSLKTIFVGDKWSMEAVQTDTFMFSECWNLIGEKGTKYNFSYTDATYARIDNPPSSPGYLTYKAS